MTRDSRPTHPPEGRQSLVVLKFGGELLEHETALRDAAMAVAKALKGLGPAVAGHSVKLVIVHGGGREIDRALRAAGIEPRQVDGLRITDGTTLEVVVQVLAGRVNTHFVAALVAADVRAVGLTGADGACGLSRRAAPHRAADGRVVDLELVGDPIESDGSELVDALLAAGFVPVVASIGIAASGGLLNVNADTLAAHLAASLRADRLVLAGTTAGVLDTEERTITALDRTAIDAMVASGTAQAGMVAKLRASAHAVSRGVAEVLIVDGREHGAIASALRGVAVDGTTRIAADFQMQVS